MHSSYALASDDFAVERDGASAPLVDLWPGGWQPDDRLGVVLANPMDAVGCSNLICGTNTLFYDDLRDDQGPGNFFRYADTYLFGVGCEPGDFNQLDVWPLHKFVVGAAADRRGPDRDRSTTAASRCSRSPRRARAAAARSSSRPGTRSCEPGALRVTLLAAHRSRARRRRRARRQPGRRELRRAGDLLDARASAPASRPGCAACAAASTASRSSLRRGVPHARGTRRAARALLGVTRGAAAGPSGGHAGARRRR